MVQISWTKLAIADLESIYDFIARDSTYYSRKTVEQIFRRVQILENHPESGREIPEYSRKDLRELIEGNYRIFYRIRQKSISVLRVHHSARKIRYSRRRNL